MMALVGIAVGAGVSYVERYKVTVTCEKTTFTVSCEDLDRK